METIGRYEIIRELGRGGMATVYLALDPRIRRQVAIKVLPRQFTHDPKFLARFKQEAQTIAALEDPAIVAIHDFGDQDDAPYIVMRYMTGGTLREKIEDRPLPLAEIGRILERLATALDMAHGQGVIHRDLKPDNVLFDDRERPYLADFGIARMAEATHTMTVVGTPAYMSPEQVQGKQKLDWRSDIYSLGVMLFEMLSGRKPYVAETTTGEMMMHVLEPVPDVLEANPALPPQTQAIIDKAMAKDRKDRYRSAGEMVRAVQGLEENGAASGEVWVASTAVIAGASIESEAQDPKVDRAPGEEGVGVEATVIEDQELTEILDPQATDGLAAMKRTVDQAPPAGYTAESISQPSGEQRGVKRLGSFSLPAWAWWGTAIAILVLLVFGIRSIFTGNGQTAEIAGDEGDSVAAVVLSATPTETAEPLVDLATVTVAPTETAIPTATNIPMATATPSPTSTLDPNRPPPNPTLGSEWQRLRDKMNMVYVPAGSFAMGSENEYNGEKPVHEVTLDGFWIDQTEVTNSQYTAFLNEMGNQEEGSVTWLSMDAVDSQIEEENGVFVSQTDYAEYPVNNVNWYGAAAYCDWVDGRLPSEAQWEYAARGPQSLNYPWGDDFDGRRANYCDKNCTYDIMDDSYDDGYTAAAPVGSFEDGASWVGALDMAGNVWEWINDWYDDAYYANSAQDNPQGPANGVSKVLRGGSWRHGLVSLRGAYRSPSDPATHYNKFGFRCALPGS